MRRSGIALLLGAAVVMSPIGATSAAWAAAPERTHSTQTFELNGPAGTFCDFTYHGIATLTEDVTESGGRTIDHIRLQIVHTNVDTGFTLHDADRIVEFTSDGVLRMVGLIDHFRGSDGKIVEVNAGQLIFGQNGDVLKFTPNTNPDRAAVVCPALGGHPAA